MTPSKGEYGHISRNQKAGGKWRWLVILAFAFWWLVVAMWNAGRVAALFGYHAALGQPLFMAGGRPWYSPWKLMEWSGQLGEYEAVGKILDQAYLMAVGVPLLLFLIYMATQQGLKGREDLHGSAKWAEFKDIEGLGYLKSEGVYVGGWWDTGWELDATGVNFKVNTRFSRFENVPELSNVYRVVADVITNEDIIEQNGGVSHLPKIMGGKPQNIVVKRSELQAHYMGIQQQEVDLEGNPVFDEDGSPVLEWTPKSIIYRMEHLPKGREGRKEDNPLKITNDARKAGLDFRLINPDAPDFEGSKVNIAADNIHRIWEKWGIDRGTQLVFCDLSTPKTTKLNTKSPSEKLDAGEDDPSFSMDEVISGESSFSVYDDLRQKLIDRGIPEHQIRFIHEAKTDIQKAKLFEQVNSGEVRVLIGSTAKMGAGTNVQERLVGMHHLDAPWRPSDLEQRNGRILRQGNILYDRDPENFEVEVIQYATEQTYDARMWQTIETKARSIEQFRRGTNLSRTIDDISGEVANAAEMKAAATGNELMFTHVRLATELKKMEGIYNSFMRGQHELEKRIKWLMDEPGNQDKKIAELQRDIEYRNKYTTPNQPFITMKASYGVKQRGDLLYEFHKAIKSVKKSLEEVYIGKYRGFDITVWSPMDDPQTRRFTLKGNGKSHHPTSLTYTQGESFNINGFLQRVDNYLNKFEVNIQEAIETRDKRKEELQLAYKNIGLSFPHKAKLEALRKDNQDIISEIQKSRNNPSYKSDWVPLSDKLISGEIEVSLDITAPQSMTLNLQ